MILQDLFPRFDSHSCETGNLLLSGNALLGAEDCFFRMAQELLSQGSSLLLADGHLSSSRRNELLNAADAYGCRVFIFDVDGCNGPAFDLLSLAKTPENAVDLLYGFWGSSTDEPSMSTIIRRYLRDCVLYLADVGREFTAQDILSLCVDDVLFGLERSGSLCPELIEDECRFLKAKAVYQAWGVLNDRTALLRACGLMDTISGRRDASESFYGPALYLVCKKAGSLSAIYPALLNGFLTVVAQSRSAYGSPRNIWLNGTEAIRRDVLRAVLQSGTLAEDLLPACVYEQSAANLLNAHGDSVLNNFSSFGVFQTTEGVFWSSFFGTAPTPEITQTNSNRRGFFTGNTGGVVPRSIGRREGTSVRRVEKNLFEPSVFLSLREKNLVFFNAFTHRRYKKQLRW